LLSAKMRVTPWYRIFFQQLGPDVTVEWVVRLHITVSPVQISKRIPAILSILVDFLGLSLGRWLDNASN
jgi:hypothetical protein